MRTKEEIKKEFDELACRIDVGAGNIYLLEVLLDIRQLLTNSSTLEGEQSEHLSPNKENEN